MRSKSSVRIWHPFADSDVELLSAGFTNEYFPPHLHDYYVFGLTSSGAGDVQCDGRSYLTRPGHVTLMAPGTVHSNRPVAGETWRLRNISVSKRLFGSLVAPKATMSGANAVFQENVVSDERLWRRLDRVFHDWADGRRDYSSFVKVLAYLMERKVMDLAAAKAPSPVAAAKSFIDANVGAPLSLRDVASAVQLSEFHMSRLFKQAYGVSPMRYFKEARLSCAKKELLCGRRVADIAAQYGFSDESHFCRSFLSKFGVTPGAYARENRVARAAN